MDNLNPFQSDLQQDLDAEERNIQKVEQEEEKDKIDLDLSDDELAPYEQ